VRFLVCVLIHGMYVNGQFGGGLFAGFYVGKTKKQMRKRSWKQKSITLDKSCAEQVGRTQKLLLNDFA